jgi:DNA-binding NarL/FixJ family response regulator
MTPTVQDTVAAVLAAQDSVREHDAMAAGGLLTARQRQVLCLVACGLSNVEIGGRLYIAEDTVKTILRVMFKQLGARNRAHAVALGFRQKIIGPLNLTEAER